MNKRYFYSELKSYFSIFIYFIFLILMFSNNMIFATTCDQIDERTTLDHCRNDNFSVLNVDKDKNVPIKRDNIKFSTFNPYKNPEYFYDKKNKYCWIWGATVTATYTAASIAATTICHTATSVYEDTLKETELGLRIKNIKTVITILEKVKAYSVKAATGIAASLLTDPIITLQGELILDTATIAWKLAQNIAACSSQTNPAACGLIAPCVAAEITLVATLEGAIFGSTGILYTLAENNINKVKVCGYDWENYVYTQHDIEEYDCDSKNLEECKNYKKLYPQKGKFSNSYSYKLEKCFRYGEEKAKSDYGVDCSEVTKKYCDLGETECKKISITSKNIKNRLYREMLYRGKEFKISTKYNNDDDKNICIDPRLDSQKGYSGSEQRYYFRGAEGAQYACNRFKYQNQKCVLDGKEYDGEKCQQAFESAYNCCINRANLGICLYNVEDEDNYGRETEYNTMCLGSSDDNREECEVKTSATSNPKFIVINDSDNYGKICAQNTNFCPYSYNVYGGTSIKDEFCDGDYSCSYSTCETKYSGDDTAIANCITKMSAEQDIIWSREHGKKVPTSAYGQAKNFLSYNAHCVDIGDMGKDPFQDMPDNKYLPKVCSDFVGDSRNLPVPFAPADLDSPVGQYLIAGVDFDLGQYRGFTAPMAQCFKETLSNMFNNKVGMSVCKDPHEVINGEGLCGNDTFYCLCSSNEQTNIQVLDNNIKKCRNNLPQCKNNEGKYVIDKNQINRDKYLRVIGDDLDVNDNIFYKIQSRLQLIIKLFAVLAIVVIGIQFLLKGDLNIFDDVKKPKAMIVGMMKFAIVFYFAVGNAWQTHFYKWLDSFVSDLYQKVFELSLLNYSPIKNTAKEIVCTKREYNIQTCKRQEFSNNGFFVIPKDVDYLKLEIYGANGGSNGTNKSAKGGYTYGELDLKNNGLGIKSGDVLYVNIGKSGGSTNKGGGATDIRTSNSKELTCDIDTDPRIIVAGGGGGAGNSSGDYDLTKNGCTNCGAEVSAGGGGQAGAGNNGSSYDQNAYGRGATSTAGGAGGTHTDGFGIYTAESGVCGFGGKGIGRTNNSYYGNGGDGWYGGGGASGEYSGGSGGGGSSYASQYLYDVGGTQGGNDKNNNGDGYAIISAYRDNSSISPELSSDTCFLLANTTENYIVEDSVLMEDQNILAQYNNLTNRCFLTNDSRICYENCKLIDQTDSSNRQTYVWDEKYDGCYFGNTKYPEGKKYLSLFDTLDCKLMNYFNYTPDIDLPGIIHFAILSVIWSPLAVAAVLLSSIFFVILLLIVIRIFYMFLMSFFMINILIYISPIVFPSLLFKNYKNMFDTWLKKLMGYSLQLVFIVVFSGLFIINLEKIGLGDAKYINHDPLTGRLPVIDCDNVDGTSLICLFNVSTSKGEIPLLGKTVKKILGLGPIISVAKSLNQDFVGTVITLLKACLILYVLLQFMKGIDKIIFEITGTGAFEGGKIDFKEKMKDLRGKLKTGARIIRYSGIAAINKAKEGKKFVEDRAKILRDLHQGKDKKNNEDDYTSEKDSKTKVSGSGVDSLNSKEQLVGGGQIGITTKPVKEEPVAKKEQTGIIGEDTFGSDSSSEYSDD